jgi:hypothetical protein
MATKAALEKFFADYARRFNESLKGNVDVEATAAAFASCFIEASIHGVICAKNDDQFRAMIPRGTDFYRSIGTTSMNIRSTEITSLDDHHDMVRVFWGSLYVKPDGAQVTIDFDVIYVLEDIRGTPKIFGYITGDEQNVLREHGLIP